MLARVKLPFLRKFFGQGNFQCIAKLLYLKRGYTANLKTYSYFQIIKQTVNKTNLLVPQEIELKNEESLKVNEEKKSIFNFLFGILLVTIRIIVIICVAFGVLTIWCSARLFALKESPVFYLKGSYVFRK